MEHKKDPVAASRPDNIRQHIRYSHINKIAGVMTVWRKSEHGYVIDHNLNKSNVLRDGQQLFSANNKIEKKNNN